MEVVRREQDRVTLRGVLAAPPAEVFDAFTVPKHLITWWPDEAVTDLRVGGAYRLSWPGHDWTLRGRYLEITRPAHLRFTWSWDHEATPERTVSIDIEPAGNGTRLTISHTFGAEEEGQSYIDGWQYFVSRLAS